jgi:Protein of unknown function (DUF1566)
MKHKLSTSLGLIVLLTIAFAASRAQAQTIAPGPYYPPPSWDQTLPSSTRFIILSNFGFAVQAVLDRETGLVWEQSPSTSTSFPWSPTVGFSTTTTTAATHCNQLTVGNRKGWRLPTIQELASLVDPSVDSPGPTLPAGHPFSNVQSSFYWSATTLAVDTENAWGVFFNDGVVAARDKITFGVFVWCVRGGQGVDPQ